jgi:hypothetical protein
MAKKKDEKTTDQSYKPSGQWASEAFDFLRLFQRVNGQVQGLIIIEIGWTLLLLLAKGLSQTDTTPIISIPYPISLWPLKFLVADSRLTTVYTFGAILIALIWFFTSGLYLYLYLPLKTLLKIFVVSLVTIVLTIIVIIPAIISVLVGFILARRWERKQDPEKIKQLREKFGANYTQKILEQVEKKNVIGEKIVRPLIGNYGKIISFLISTAGIGLAPFYSYSFEEDMKAAKAPMQIFAAAIGTLQTKLRNLDDLRKISFWSIPTVIKVDSAQRAHFIRRWMGLDTILWGSYLSIDPPLIWLNIEQEQSKGNSQKSSTENKLDSNKFHPFPRMARLKDYIIVVNQDDLLDIYIVLLITLIHTLNIRQDKRRRGIFFSLDKFGYSMGTENQIMLHLIRDALFSIERKIENPASKDFYPPARKVLVDIAGQWIGHQMEFGGGFGDHFSSRALKEVAVKCIELEPDNANHYYRLAAIECVIGDEEAANKAIGLAQEYDQAKSWVDPIELVSEIDVEFGLLDGILGDTSYKLAKIAALSAQAITTGEYAKASLKEAFVKTVYWQFIETEITETINKSEILSLKILCNLLSLRIPPKYKQQMTR